MAEMMRMMLQLVEGGNRDSFGPTPEGSAPLSKNETRPPPNPNQGQTTPTFVPQGGDQKLNPHKDKTSEFGYS